MSVVICCYNSSKQLPFALKSLSTQTAIGELNLELIVVDNNSEDDSAECARQCWKRLGEPFELRVVDEPTQGLSHARKRGIAEAKYDTILLVDDDNILDSGYLAIAASLLRAHPNVAAFGGEVHAVFEPGIREPDWFREIDGIFTVGSKGPAASYCLSTCGAGMVIRKAALADLFSADFDFSLSDRTGRTLSGGGDVELCLALHLIGWKVWYDPRLQLGHLVPAKRLTWSYAAAVSTGMGQAEVFLQPYRMRVSAMEGSNPRLLQLRHNWTIQLCVRTLQAVWWRARAYGKGWFRGALNRETMVAVRYAAFARALWRNRKRYSDLYRALDRYGTR